jgi:hypothetical protein
MPRPRLHQQRGRPSGAPADQNACACACVCACAEPAHNDMDMDMNMNMRGHHGMVAWHVTLLSPLSSPPPCPSPAQPSPSPVLVPPRAPCPRLTTARTDVTQLPDKPAHAHHSVHTDGRMLLLLRPHIPSNPSRSASPTNPHARTPARPHLLSPWWPSCEHRHLATLPRDLQVAPPLHNRRSPMPHVAFVAMAPFNSTSQTRDWPSCWCASCLLFFFRRDSQPLPLVVPLSCTPAPMLPFAPDTPSIAIPQSHPLPATPSAADSRPCATTTQPRLPNAHGVPSDKQRLATPLHACLFPTLSAMASSHPSYRKCVMAQAPGTTHTTNLRFLH